MRDRHIILWQASKQGRQKTIMNASVNNQQSIHIGDMHWDTNEKEEAVAMMESLCYTSTTNRLYSTVLYSRLRRRTNKSKGRANPT
jgi:hypothetical protein